MPYILAQYAGDIPVSSREVYEILADYRRGHPAILPPAHFGRVVVDQGGRGEGTVVQFRMHLLGRTTDHRVVVDEPEPGRVLTETDTRSGAVTTFVVDSANDGLTTRLTIATEWRTPGLRGWMERLVAPSALRKVYAQEVQRLVNLVRGTRYLQSSRRSELGGRKVA